MKSVVSNVASHLLLHAGYNMPMVFISYVEFVACQSCRKGQKYIYLYVITIPTERPPLVGEVSASWC
jgi:hypothetical protein